MLFQHVFASRETLRMTCKFDPMVLQKSRSTVFRPTMANPHSNNVHNSEPQVKKFGDLHSSEETHPSKQEPAWAKPSNVQILTPRIGRSKTPSGGPRAFSISSECHLSRPFHFCIHETSGSGKLKLLSWSPSPASLPAFPAYCSSPHLPSSRLILS